MPLFSRYDPIAKYKFIFFTSFQIKFDYNLIIYKFDLIVNGFFKLFLIFL
nr:MAG TPA: hypothetical protein [Caudoviricetes sp.]DAZ81788.1 MAG TPA: hypothetical protein [Caudoviricetes sp.]